MKDITLRQNKKSKRIKIIGTYDVISLREYYEEITIK